EVRLPGVVALTDEIEHAFALEILLLTEALVEIEVVVEDETLVVEQVEHHRQVGGADQKRSFGAAAIEVTILCVERDCEQAGRAPFEAAPLAVRQLELRTSPPLDDVDDLLEHVALRDGRLSRRQIVEQHVAEVAAAIEM